MSLTTMRITADDHCCKLLAGLRTRQPEIRQAILGRVRAIGDPGIDGDGEYIDGLRPAIEAAIDHPDDLPVPLPLIGQARLAARRRLPMETMLRRYLAGHAVLGDLVIEEAEGQRVSASLLRRILRSQAGATEKIRPLLNGELLDTSDLNYDFEHWQIGLIMRGSDATRQSAGLADCLDGQMLVVPGDDCLVWAWLGSRARLEPDMVEAAIRGLQFERVRVGIGEPGEGRAGWRVTYHQAQAAFSVAD